MMTFNEYWKEKGQKRRKSWAAKAKRFAEQHTQLEDIRKEVYLPLDYGANFSFDDYKPEHFIKLNPITSWQDKNFCFSEEGLRAALNAEGADMNSFRMSVSHQPIKGLEAPQPENEWEAYRFMKPNKVYDYDKMYRSWLQRIYEICTDMETVSLSYRQITMIIKRYSTEGMPFGYYELNPCEQLTKSAMLMQETDFYILNVATLLMEAAAEWELRQEELNHYAKKLKIRTMEAELDKVIVRSFPIYELLQIRIEGHRYPRRRICQQRLGFFDTKEHAEEAMLSTIKFQKWVCLEREKNYYDDCFGFFLFEQFIHNRESSFYRNERPQKCFSFNANGELNDFVALDEMGWYRGRKKEDIRFKVGDIVEVVEGDYADLVIVGALPLTTDRYSRLEDDPEECEHPSHFLDESDDCYLVYTLGETGSHIHPVCYTVFPPTHPVPEKYVAQLQTLLREIAEDERLLAMFEKKDKKK